jgi:hypothetical protein
LLTLIMTVAALGACDRFVGVVEPREEEDFAKQYIALFQVGDFDAIEAKLDARLREHDPNVRVKLQQMAAQFEGGSPKAVQTVGWRFLFKNGVKNFDFAFQYELPTKWLIAEMSVERTGDQLVIMRATFRTVKESLENTNAFTLSGKPLSSYLFLCYAVVSPLLMAFALVRCLRTSGPRLKWVWIVFILTGVAQVTLNWTTGAFAINVLFLEFLGSWVGGGGFAPVSITSSVPIGAVVFLHRYSNPAAPASSF